MGSLESCSSVAHPFDPPDSRRLKILERHCAEISEVKCIGYEAPGGVLDEDLMGFRLCPGAVLPS